MSYFEARLLSGETVAGATARVTEALKAQGFGVLTTIDVKETLKAKIGADFRPYTILGACNPALAHQALQAEEHIGLMLPCNVVVQEKDGGAEVAAVDPVASMAAVGNPTLAGIAEQVRDRLRQVVQAL
ncbi:MAG: DUF302 domain-containing protein [Rhodospirillales bacterium]|nr:DUF302 domain-containing protein [Rhodospirillales bacterium]